MSLERKRQDCQCADPGCGACNGLCSKGSRTLLFRVDMVDESGTWFCGDCADDAMDSGVFRKEND
jgi:hypothetical protein